jgi:archaetidylinositol phosphate synthase
METSAVRSFKDANRVIVSVLAPAERKTLQFLAARMPGRVNSDHLTALALAAMLGAGLSFWLARFSSVGLLLVVICLALNWFGDSLDGTLARYRSHQRPRYGYYVDHVVDAFGALFLFAGLGASGFMSPLVAMGLLVGYLMLSAETYLAAHVLGEFKITHFQMGPTELRILLAIGTLVLFVKPVVVLFGQSYRLFDVGGVVGIVGMFVTLVVAAISHTRTLYIAEPLPGRARKSQ